MRSGEDLVITAGNKLGIATVQNFFNLAEQTTNGYTSLELTLSKASTAAGQTDIPYSVTGTSKSPNHFYIGGYGSHITGGQKFDLVFAAGAKSTYAVLSAGEDRFYGSLKADIVYGGADNDYLRGMSGLADPSTP